MKVIQANCRVQFEAGDVDFIADTLAPGEGKRGLIVKLLSDPEARDLILDDEKLYRAILESPGYLKISTRLYFYVLVRRVLQAAGIADREVADYVAEVLSVFSRWEHTRSPVRGRERSAGYFFEMLEALQNADERTGFYIRTHIGNQSLFLSGVFAEWIRHRARHRGSPDLSYYEELGRSNFRAASDHRLARRYALAPVYEVLADQFRAARLALNELAERLVSLGEDPGISRIVFG